VLLALAEKRVFEHQAVVLLFYFVKVVHVQLSLDELVTCLTKEEKLECLKYFGSISLVKESTSWIINPTLLLSQEIILSYYGCFDKNPQLLKESHKF
jgi:hypothetical protein